MGLDEDQKAGAGSYTNQNAAGTQAAYDYMNPANNPMLRGMMNYTPDQVTAQMVNASRSNRGDVRDLSVDNSQANNITNAALQNAYGNRYNVGAGFGDFTGNAAAIQQVSMGNFSPLTQGLNQQANRQARLGMDTVAGQLGSRNALFSGAGAAALGEAGMNPFAQVQNTLGMQQAGLAGNLMNQNMGLSYNDRQYGNQAGFRMSELGLQGADRFLAGNQLGLQAGMANQSMDWNVSNLNTNLAQQAAIANQTAALQAAMSNQTAGLQHQANLGNIYGTTAGVYGNLGQQNLTYNPTQGDRNMQGAAAAGSILSGIGGMAGGLMSGAGGLASGISEAVADK